MTTPANPQSTTVPSTTLGPATSLQYPRDYFFPPFFTRQPILATHHAQCAKWASWILSYCRHHRLWKLSLVDAIDTDLFWNKKIDKRLGLADAREVLEWMRGQGRVEWIAGGKGGGGGGGEGGGEGRTVCWVWWRTPEEWAVAIAEWVSELVLLVSCVLCTGVGRMAIGEVRVLMRGGVD
jgi:ESCRT-II complex subunit VPS25